MDVRELVERLKKCPENSDIIFERGKVLIRGAKTISISDGHFHKADETTGNRYKDSL